MYFLSLDGGATKTVAVVYDDNFHVYGLGVSGSSNFRNVGLRNFRNHIREAVKKAINYSNGINPERVTYALAGIKDSKASTDFISNNINKMFPEFRNEFYNDGEVGFYSRFPEGEGIIVAPGTGMVSYGVYKDKVVRSSGWGWFLDDEGGAFFIGRRTLSEIIKIIDNRSEQESVLVDVIRKFYNLKDDRDLVNKVYKKTIDIREIASIARFVSGSAIKGDKLAKTIMNEAAEETAKTIKSVYYKLDCPNEIKISGYGGVFRSGDWYWDLIGEKIGDLRSKMIPPIYGYEAVIGSIVFNYKRLGINVSDKDIEYLRQKIDEKINGLSKKDKAKYLLID